MTNRTPRAATGRSPAAVGGAVLGVGIALVVLWLLPQRRLRPDVIRSPLVPEDAGEIEEVVFHFVPTLKPLVEAAYADFLGTLDPSTRLVAVVPGRDATGSVDGAGELRRFLRTLDATGAVERRTRVVEVGGPISVWSKDRALVLGPATSGKATGLLVPVPPGPGWPERTNDWQTPTAIASSMPDRFYVRALPLDFDAGDFAVTGGRLVVDVNLFTKNRHRGFASPKELLESLRRLFARDVAMLGAADGDVPRHHLSMYMTPLGDGLVLVGDPRAAAGVVGREFVPGEASPDTGEVLRADFSESTTARFERAASDLAAAGFRVERIPVIPLDDKTYLTYTNGVYETRDGRRIAWVPHYGVERLDDLARGVYERLGWQVRRVRTRALYPYHGTIGCLVNVLARAESRR